MKKLTIFVAFVLVVSLSLCMFSCASNNSKKVNTQPTKTAVVYFSITGNTETIANYIAEIKGADVFEIEAKIPYTQEDLAYEDNTNRSSLEQADDTSRPEMAKAIDLSEYATVYIGYPIWHGIAPRIIYTFFESQTFGWKHIIPFCTSAESPVGESVTLLKNLNRGGHWEDGIRFAENAPKADIEAWLATI